MKRIHHHHVVLSRIRICETEHGYDGFIIMIMDQPPQADEVKLLAIRQ